MVDWWNRALRTLIGGYGSLFGELHPFVSLTVLSVLVGVGMLWVFARVSNQDAIRRTKKRLQAYLLELRLFGDEPALLWKSQKDLLRANIHYLSLMLRPALILTVPVVILLFHLDGVYGLAPLPVGEPAVVTVQAIGQISSNTAAPRLVASAGFTVETPAVRVLEESQFSWRIRPLREAAGELRFNWNGAEWEKTIASGEGSQYLSSRRVRSWLDALWNPGEDRLRGPRVEWVEVRYPPAAIEIAGIEIHWLIWFLVISVLSAYLLKGYFNVAV